MNYNTGCVSSDMRSTYWRHRLKRLDQTGFSVLRLCVMLIITCSSNLTLVYKSVFKGFRMIHHLCLNKICMFPISLSANWYFNFTHLSNDSPNLHPYLRWFYLLRALRGSDLHFFMGIISDVTILGDPDICRPHWTAPRRPDPQLPNQIP